MSIPMNNLTRLFQNFTAFYKNKKQFVKLLQLTLMILFYIYASV